MNDALGHRYERARPDGQSVRSAATAVKPESGERESWLRRRLRSFAQTIDRLIANPREITALVREHTLSIWSSKGGGFYGLGYVVAFVCLEIRMFFDEIVGSDDIAVALGEQAVGLVFRFAIDSFVNGLLAFLWPVLLLDYTGVWGIALLGAVWLAYSRLLSPRFAAWRDHHLSRDRTQRPR